MSASDKRLRKALRGGDGYKEQRAAWDAVFPDWPRLRKLTDFVFDHKHRNTDAEHAERRTLVAAIRADPRPWVINAWFEFQRQATYRRAPFLGGWFPR